MALTRPIYIVAAKRTAFGTFGGKFRDITATHLGAHSTNAALEAGSVDPSAVDTIVFGNCMQVS